MNNKIGGSTFNDRKVNLIRFIQDKFGTDIETLNLIELLNPIPLQLKAPLTDEFLNNIVIRENILDVREDLTELVYSQNKLELKNMKETKIKLEQKKLEIIGQLVKMKEELSKIKSHEYRPNINEWIEDIKKDDEKIHELYLEVIDLMNQWNKKES